MDKLLGQALRAAETRALIPSRYRLAELDTYVKALHDQSASRLTRSAAAVLVVQLVPLEREQHLARLIGRHHPGPRR